MKVTKKSYDHYFTDNDSHKQKRESVWMDVGRCVIGTLALFTCSLLLFF